MTKESINLKQVMFVCGGNTCRSPMAEYLFRDMCKKEGLDIKSVSRGFLIDNSYSYNCFFGDAREGISRESIEVLKQYNPSIQGLEKHVARLISRQNIIGSGLIFAMTEALRDIVIDKAILSSKNEEETREMIESRIFTLKEYAGETANLDIADPIGAGGTIVEDRKGRQVWIYNKEKALRGYEKCRDEILYCLKKIVKEIKHPFLCKIERPTMEEILLGRKVRRAEAAIQKAKMAKIMKAYQQPHNYSYLSLASAGHKMGEGIEEFEINKPEVWEE